MAYEVYHHKQQAGGVTESPSSSIGMTQAPSTGKLLVKGGAVALIGGKVIQGAKQYVSKVVSVSGDSRLKRRFETAGKITSTGTTLVAGAVAAGPVGFLVAAAGETLGFAFGQGQRMITEEIDQNKNSYDRQLQGTKIQGFGSGVDYYG